MSKAVLSMPVPEHVRAMQQLERSLAYEHCLGVLNAYCVVRENEDGEEAFNTADLGRSRDVVNEAVRYLDWRGLLLRGVADPRWAVVLDEDEEEPR